MSNKIYVCRECGYVFPSELSQLIGQNIQVFCERCGSPFTLEGIIFKPAPSPYKKVKKHTFSKKDSTNLEKIIIFLNKISFIPLLIFTSISFGLIAEIAYNWENWYSILFNRFWLGLIGLILLIYDRAYIAHKIKERKYNEIFIDSFCWGILGCILFGTGVIILIKGIFIIIYVFTNSENKELKSYDYGLLIKNSFNNFSVKAGFLIIFFAIYSAYSSRLYLVGTEPLYIGPYNFVVPSILLNYVILLSIAVIALLIDIKIKKEIEEKRTFKAADVVKVFILGILGTIFYAAGIFILLQGILLFFLYIGKPSERIQPVSTEPIYYPPKYTRRQQPIEEPLREERPAVAPTPPVSPKPPEPPKMISQEKTVKIVSDNEKKEKIEISEKIPPKIIEKEREEKQKEFKTRLHDSLLPVKDENDKKLVKEYFSKIFAVLSKDLRKQINSLKISKKEKKELLEELAFLTKEEQLKYIEALTNLYREIPRKLIERIRKLPNVEPKHYDKIVSQLKYMDSEEQIKFVQFLEENA